MTKQLRFYFTDSDIETYNRLHICEHDWKPEDTNLRWEMCSRCRESRLIGESWPYGL